MSKNNFLSHAERKFEYGGLYTDSNDDNDFNDQNETSFEFLEYIKSEIIGEGNSFPGPFGHKKMIYCDYTASGKSLKFIENYIQEEVLPFYANTHTTTSMTGRQSHFYRNESRDLIKGSINASEDDVLLFTGTGATFAIHKLIDSFGLNQLLPNDLVVFISPYEHHSNLLPWREIGAKIITIPEDESGSIDINILELELQKHYHYRVKIGSFSAASNVTGILSDQNTITACLHRFEALSFWDYATAAPYIKIDMNPIVEGIDRHLVYKDAIFISPHKFLGGPGTPGLLCAKRKLFQRNSPKECGGGTVFFVSREDHRYLSSIEEREEGGTPDIIGSIRCGLIFQLKEQIGVNFIHEREQYFIKKVKEELLPLNNFKLLGSCELDRLPIFSFKILHAQSGLYLHYNFICSILNDLYGIQVRGGCVCAGPYSQELLGIDMNLSKRFENCLLKLSSNDNNLNGLLPRERDRQGAGTELLRPGFVRINFHYTMDNDTFQYVLDALKQISEHGWKLLPFYKFNTDTGEWLHKKWSLQRGRKWLGSIRYYKQDKSIGFNIPTFQSHPRNQSVANSLTQNELPNDKNIYYSNCLKENLLLFENPPIKKYLPDDSLFTKEENDLRWFLLPFEASEYIKGINKDEHKPIFTIKTFKNKINNKKEIININSTLIEEKQEEKEEYVNNEQEITDIDILDDFNFENEEEDDNININNNSSFKFHVPSKYLLHCGFAAITDFNMINNGDRVIVCVSGGKDSLTLLHLLKHYQFVQRSKGIQFDLAAATVDPLIHSSFDPRPLKVYMKALHIPYFYLADSIMERAKNAEECKSICSYCSRMKRGILQTCARKENYNVLALGQHLDDLAESFIMSLFHNGLLTTMKANYTNREGDLRIIRPLAYARERELAKFAADKKLPVIPENCPACFEAPKERHRIKQLLAAQENIHKDVFNSIKVAIKPLVAINKTDIEGKVNSEINFKQDNNSEDINASIIDF